MIKLISNKELNSHQNILTRLLAKADEVFIAVAFLKLSGLKMIVPYFDKDAQFSIIAGANFGLTEPAALRELLRQSEKENVRGYLNSLGAKRIFHPKMYLIRTGKRCHLIIGSANLTSGGLEKNDEISIYHKCSTEDRIWKDAVRQFNIYIDPVNADILGEEIISLYERYHNKQKTITQKVAPCPEELDYNIHKLKLRFDAMDRTDLNKAFKEKSYHYQQARGVLDQIISMKHSKGEFEGLLEKLVGKSGELGWWHSSGMHRHKTDIFRFQNLFVELIKNIKSNINNSPELIYDRAKAVSDQIHGTGPNFIGEIMMTYAPERLANINRNPLTVLRKFGANINKHTSTYTGRHYQSYLNIVLEVKRTLGLKNMLEVDYFFDKIYKTIPHD